nr:hypothetical protein [Gammaproteobacteria bacterium]
MPKELPTTASPPSELQQLRAQVAEQAKLIEQLRQRIAELEARLAKDSHNSSKPPSSDRPFRKPPPRSQRKVSGRKPGGQEGHKGATRPLVDNPDHQVVIPLKGTCTCGRCRSQIPVQITPSGAKSSSWSSAARSQNTGPLPVRAPVGVGIAATFPRTSARRCNTGRACRRSPST